MKTVEIGTGRAREHTIFGISRTNKGVLAMRSTSTDKHASRLSTFTRDGDTGVVLVNLERVMHKSEAAGILVGSEEYLRMTEAAGHERTAVIEFLNRVGAKSTTVAALSDLEPAADAAAAETPAADAAADAAAAETPRKSRKSA
jgi:hypothetical protein